MKKDRKVLRKMRKKRFLRRYQSLPLERQKRLCVTRTSQHLIAQVIEDATRSTVVAASTLEKTFRAQKELRGIERARALGSLIAQRAKEKGLEEVVFDRNGFIYQGQIKAFAESARESGLKF